MVDKAKQVKKLVQQNRWSLEEIAKMADITQEQVAVLYTKYTGQELPPTLMIVGHDDLMKELSESIRLGTHVILHGEPGVGKTSTAMYVVRKEGKILRKINLSDKRTGNMLAEELYGSHKTTSDNVFLFDEIDNFHWQSYAYFKKVLEESAVSVIMTCNDLKKVSKEIVKWVKENGKVIAVAPPTRDDLRKFIEIKFPAKITQVDSIYDKDFRVVLRRLLYGFSETNENNPVITCEQAAGLIFGEKNENRKMSRIDRLKDPLLWLIPWLDYNSIRFMKDIDMLGEFLDKVSVVDSWITRTNQQFIKTMFVALPCPGRKGTVDFPAALFNAEKAPEKKVEEEDVKETKMEIAKTNQKTYQPTLFDPFNF